MEGPSGEVRFTHGMKPNSTYHTHPKQGSISSFHLEVHPPKGYTTNFASREI